MNCQDLDSMQAILHAQTHTEFDDKHYRGSFYQYADKQTREYLYEGTGRWPEKAVIVLHNGNPCSGCLANYLKAYEKQK